jgi:hypothetical protein
MNKLIRGVVTGTLIGAGVGLVMLMMRNRQHKVMTVSPGRINQQTRGTLRMVKDNALRWTSAVKSGTEAFSRKLARRTS